jgi:hypothetical protein
VGLLYTVCPSQPSSVLLNRTSKKGNAQFCSMSTNSRLNVRVDAAILKHGLLFMRSYSDLRDFQSVSLVPNR